MIWKEGKPGFDPGRLASSVPSFPLDSSVSLLLCPVGSLLYYWLSRGLLSTKGLGRMPIQEQHLADRTELLIGGLSRMLRLFHELRGRVCNGETTRFFELRPGFNSFSAATE